MPNWCSNTLLLRGKEEDITRLLDTVADTDTTLSLAKIIAVPEALKNASSPNRDETSKEENIKLYGASDWYDFQTSRWGTKWDVNATITYDSHLRTPGWQSRSPEATRTVSMSFESAWAPPQPAIDMLAKQFPMVDIYLSYDEPGCDFSGYAMYSGGECVRTQDFESWSNIRHYIEPDIDIFEYFPDKEEGKTNATETVSSTTNV